MMFSQRGCHTTVVLFLGVQPPLFTWKEAPPEFILQSWHKNKPKIELFLSPWLAANFENFFFFCVPPFILAAVDVNFGQTDWKTLLSFLRCICGV